MQLEGCRDALFVTLGIRHVILGEPSTWTMNTREQVANARQPLIS